MAKFHDEQPIIVDSQEKRKISKKFVAAFVILLIISFLFLLGGTLYFSLYYQTKHKYTTLNLTVPNPPINSLDGRYSKGAVAADNVICSEIGRNILLRGGNAVDAAIATMSCIGVMDTHSTGMGGGHFMTIYNATEKKCYVIDARHVAPQAANSTMFGNNYIASELGWLSILVPGEVAGMWKAYSNFKSGKVSWKDLIQPTVDLLAGYPTSDILQMAFDEWYETLLREPTMKWAFNPNAQYGNETWKAGELINTRQVFKNFTQIIADSEFGSSYGTNPHEVFYNSIWTQRMASEFANNSNNSLQCALDSSANGIITVNDFQNYSAILRPDNEVIYAYLKNGRAICGAPPPSSGAVVAAILGILDGFDYPQNPNFDEEVENFHRFIESSKFAFAARLDLGDIAFVRNALSIAKNIVTENWTSATRAKISNTTQPDSYYNGTENFYIPNVRGTSHIGVLDAEGNAVAVTSTINLFFGAKVASDSTGVIWNNEMNDFSLPGLTDYFGFIPTPSNYIEPGKRPMSSMSPIVVFNQDGNVEDVNVISLYGSAGGSEIISTTAINAWRNLWLGHDIKHAMDFPRLHNQYRPNYTFYEDRLPDDYIQALVAKGHSFNKTDYIGTATSINKPSNRSLNFSQNYRIFANSDFRKGAQSGPAGY